MKKQSNKIKKTNIKIKRHITNDNTYNNNKTTEKSLIGITTGNDKILDHPDINLVTNSLEYYDKNVEEHHNILKKIKYCKFIDSNKDLEYNKIIFYDKDKNELFISRYENIGIYKDQLWTWAWSIPSLSKNSTNIIRKILTYGTELDSNSLFVKNELITSNFKISHDTQIDIILSISAYLSKKTFIYGLKLYDSINIDFDGYINLLEPSVEGKELTFNTHYLFLLDIPKLEKN
jgi:hypothetical protein